MGKTNFEDVITDKGLKEFNSFMMDKSYIEGYTLSDIDFQTYTNFTKPPPSQYPHALRWYNHVKSFGPSPSPAAAATATAAAAAAACPKPPSKAESKKATAPQPPTAAPITKDDDDDDVDLFASDDDEDAEAAKVREERLKAYNEKKAKKPELIAKSSIVLDVKPWDDETDMKEMEKVVRTIEMDGLVWGASKLVPVGYGINKLQIMCVVEDAKVSVDELVEKIEEFEDYVQSVDIAAFNKI